MKFLLLGSNGQVGWELRRALAPLGEVIALDREERNGLCGDLSRLDALAETVRRAEPDVIVNAAAYTAVDKAESEPDLARTINADAPAVLATEAAKTGAWLVHYSTDYVFDGSGERPWQEMDPPAPLNVYGATKLAGEEAIRDSACKHLIFRTSWVYAARGANFIRTMLRVASEKSALKVIDDQVGAPNRCGVDRGRDRSRHTGCNAGTRAHWYLSPRGRRRNELARLCKIHSGSGTREGLARSGCRRGR